ncbi:hypothetical protein KFL_001510040 [Klebsormidium nitens]|uniref:NmrA-like domain-containing protein n=1 Tax=Klebsormidium nitens TaxID=105231 RepID=A0A1Y1HXV7_KLENI|nr:hypothetical protein KFL_001510040 [Klebsormidium nitens]|eukprot:GAQ83500.1 hypothetical protein KFL_001510040 [Klebsormidium nitens]
MAPKTVVTMGTSGYIGKATLAALGSPDFADKFVVKAGVRDVSKGLGDLAPNTALVAADYSKRESMKAAFTGADVVILIAPGVENRTQLLISALEVAKEVGVPFVILFSVPTVQSAYGRFGSDFLPIEQRAKDLGLPHVACRIPIFTDNQWGNKDSIVGQGCIYCPQKPDAGFVTITTADVGLAFATIANDGVEKHVGKAYFLCCPKYTYNDLTKAFSDALGKPVNYVQVPYEVASQQMQGSGYPGWIADGTCELMKGIDAEVPDLVTYSDDFETIVGRKATSIQEWVKACAPGFKA